MNKPELMKLLSEKSGVARKDVEAVIDALTEVVAEEVHKKGDNMPIPGLGVFKQKITNARTGRNPQTGAAIQIPSKTKVVFAPASALK